jgi:hypothetical protein
MSAIIKIPLTSVWMWQDFMTNIVHTVNSSYNENIMCDMHVRVRILDQPVKDDLLRAGVWLINMFKYLVNDWEIKEDFKWKVSFHDPLGEVVRCEMFVNIWDYK